MTKHLYFSMALLLLLSGCNRNHTSSIRALSVHNASTKQLRNVVIKINSVEYDLGQVDIEVYRSCLTNEENQLSNSVGVEYNSDSRMQNFLIGPDSNSNSTPNIHLLIKVSDTSITPVLENYE